MGTNNLTSIGTGTPVEATGDLVDQYLTAISTDFVPRNASGIVTSVAGSLGSSTYKWASLYVDDVLINGSTLSTTTTSDLNLTAFAGQDIVMTTSSGGVVSTSGDLNVGGELTLSNQPVFIANSDSFNFNDSPDDFTFSNANVHHEVGGDWFDSTVDTSKITPPSNGTYKIIFELDGDNTNYDTKNIVVEVARYNSSDVLQNSHLLIPLSHPGDVILPTETIFRITTGDYIKLNIRHTSSGNTGTVGADTVVSIYKLF